MKKIYLLSLLLSSIGVYAVEYIPSKAVITVDTEMTGKQTITDQELTISENTTLTLKSGARLSIINETNITKIVGDKQWTSPLNNSGTINVEEGATLKLVGEVNTNTQSYHTEVGTINVSGTVITDTPSTTPYNLCDSGSNIVINKGGQLSITVNEKSSARMGIGTSQSITINSESGLLTSEFYLAYQDVAAEASKIICGTKNAFHNLNGEATDIRLAQGSNIIFDMQAGITNIGSVMLQNASNSRTLSFIFAENKGGDVFNIGSFANNIDKNATNTNLTFYNFENDFIKVSDISNLSISENGDLIVLRTTNGVDYTWTIQLTAIGDKIVDGENVIWQKEFSDGWYITENGFLNNSNFTIAVPEPAEWAMILGTVVLGLAIYRRRR
ncbi:MAG: hypothetical protein J6K91_06655 [Opitutales bacterium]|nr:hypothetical protein [Opitutales bacterium]